MIIPEWLVDISKIMSLLVLLGQIVFAWLLWSLRKEFVTREHCDKTCKNFEATQTALKTAQRDAPTGKDMGALEVRLAEIEGDIKVITTSVTAQASVMERLERPINLLIEHHIKEGGK